MSNPLFSMMQMNPFMQKFQQFRQMFTGNAQQQVQQLLNSGRVSQAQYNQAVNMAQQMANQFKGMLGTK